MNVVYSGRERESGLGQTQEESEIEDEKALSDNSWRDWAMPATQLD